MRSEALSRQDSETDDFEDLVALQTNKARNRSGHNYLKPNVT